MGKRLKSTGIVLSFFFLFNFYIFHDFFIRHFFCCLRIVVFFVWNLSHFNYKNQLVGKLFFRFCVHHSNALLHFPHFLSRQSLTFSI